MGLGGDAHVALALLGVGGQGGVLAVHQIVQHLGHRGLPPAEDVHVVGDDDVLLAALEIGHHVVFQHGGQLAGGAGQHDDGAAVLRLERAPRGGAVVVLEHVAALGQPGLFLLVLADVLLVEVVLDALQAGLVEHQLLPGAGGGSLLGQVIGGGPQAPCHNQQTAAGDGRLHRMAQALHIVPHHGGVQQVDAQPRELLGHNGRIQIDHLAQQQLGAHRNNLSVHLGSSFSDCSWSRGSAGSPKNREP